MLTKQEVMNEVERINRGIFSEYTFNELDEKLKELGELKEKEERLNEEYQKAFANEEESILEEISELDKEEASLLEEISEIKLDDETYYEAIHEQVDGHEWVIYCAYHSELYSLFKNDNNVYGTYEELSCGVESKDIDELLGIFAYSCLYRLCAQEAEKHWTKHLERSME